MINPATPPKELPMVRRKIELPWVRRAVMHELATSGEPQTRIAERYGVAQSTLSEFASRHAAEIAEIRNSQEAEFAGILIARKAERLATYQAALQAALEVDDDGNVRVLDHQAVARYLRQTAEEMGHLPQRIQMGGEVGVRTTYEIVGVDPEALK